MWASWIGKISHDFAVQIFKSINQNELNEFSWFLACYCFKGENCQRGKILEPFSTVILTLSLGSLKWHYSLVRISVYFSLWYRVIFYLSAWFYPWGHDRFANVEWSLGKSSFHWCKAFWGQVTVTLHVFLYKIFRAIVYCWHLLPFIYVKHVKILVLYFPEYSVV